jgi:hypothetical protein
VPKASSRWADAAQRNTILSQIQSTSSVTLGNSFRAPAYLARLLMDGQMVQFKSHEEKAAVEEEAKKIADRRAQDPSRLKADKGAPPHKFGGVSSEARQNMTDKVVAGKHRGLEYLRDASKQTQWQYNIMKMAFMNDTYLRKDRLKFVNKVRSLLPASYTSMDPPKSKIQARTARAKA